MYIIQTPNYFKNIAYRESLEKRRGEIKHRWEKLEARRRARMQYYHAKIHHERSMNLANPIAENDNDESSEQTLE